MPTNKLDFVKQAALFRGADEAALAQIAQYLFEKRLLRGESVLNEGGEAQALYFVAEGVIKLYKTSAEGKEQIISLLRPGDFFNEVPLLDNRPAPANAEALGPALLYGLQKSNLRVILRQYAQVTGNLLGMLARRVRYLISLVEDLSFHSVTARVAKILLEYATLSAETGTQLTQRDMAAIAGTAREVVSRSLKHLEDRKLIEMRKHQILIKNLAGLKALVEPAI
jgi:CRP/FNR family transcriptional regulator